MPHPTQLGEKVIFGPDLVE
jgi:hypothetical protein